MPEGDAVHLTARRLHAALADKVVTRSDLRSPRFATADLRGQTVTEVVARGKHLLLRTDDGLTLHTHLKMDGVWRLYWPGERWREPTFQARAIVEVPDRQAVGFRLAIVELLRTDREGDVLGHLGPDVLGPDWDPDEALRRLTGDPAREIGEALVDQRVMAGPGNVYKSEALFLRGIHPRTPVGRVGDPTALVGLVKRLMEANRHTGIQVTTGIARRGHGRWVYRRADEPCRRCGTPIERIAQGPPAAERLTFLCPSCQPLAADP